MVIKRVSIPCLRNDVLFDVIVEDGVFAAIDPVADKDKNAKDTATLWPGYVECHAHLGLPANFDDTLDDPRIIAMQYLFHGVTHVVDMFGFPLVKALWESGRKHSAVPYPALAHCGYAVTSMRNREGLFGHGNEFPAPVFMLGVQDDIEIALQANSALGSSFIKVMFTEGVEQPGLSKRFSRMTSDLLRQLARVSRERNLQCVLDCNTRDEVLQAYQYGFRLFAHPVRDVLLSDSDWKMLSGARFISTLSGLRPMVMERSEFLREYGRPGFHETQDNDNLRFVSTIEEPFGIRFNCQESRTMALRVMRQNCLAALERDALLLGTDCGNTGAFHGYSLLGELEALDSGENDSDRHDKLMHAATIGGRQFFESISSEAVTRHPIATGTAATFNLFAPQLPANTTFPTVTVIDGVTVDRNAVVQTIQALRASDTKGKVIL